MLSNCYRVHVTMFAIFLLQRGQTDTTECPTHAGGCSGVGNDDNNNNIHICIAPYGRNFRGAGPGSVLVGVRRGKRVSLGEEQCL